MDLISEGNGYWSVDVPGAGEGQKYKFWVNHHPRIDPRATEVTNSTGDGVLISRDYPWQHGLAMPPANELVIYQMHIGTFPDRREDAINAFGAAVHDFYHLRDLGVNAIQLLPVLEFPGDHSGGYNPSHIFAVESSYGGPRGLKWFIDQAHASGFSAFIDDDRDLSAVAAALSSGQLGGGHRRVIYTESHDAVDGTHGKKRVPDEIAPGNAEGWHARKRSMLGAAMLMTAPGIPMIFQGQEVLEWAPFDPGRGVDWGPSGPPGRGFPFLPRSHPSEAQLGEQHPGPAGPAHQYPARGEWGQSAGVSPMGERGAGDNVMVVINLSHQSFSSYRIGVPHPGLWYVRLNSDSRIYSPDFSDFPGYHAHGELGSTMGAPFSAAVGLGPYSCLVLSQ